MGEKFGHYQSHICQACIASTSGRCSAHSAFEITFPSAQQIFVLGLTVEQIEKLKQFFEMHTGRKATDI